MRSIRCSILGQWFSNFSGWQNHLEVEPGKTEIADPIPRVSDSVGVDAAWEFAFCWYYWSEAPTSITTDLSRLFTWTAWVCSCLTHCKDQLITPAAGFEAFWFFLHLLKFHCSACNKYILITNSMLCHFKEQYGGGAENWLSAWNQHWMFCLKIVQSLILSYTNPTSKWTPRFCEICFSF